MLVLHYTGMADAASALARLTDPAAGVSAHWVVDEDGTLWRLVDEAAMAWHAGVSAWRGRRRLNANSIGIEIVNGGHEYGLPPFPPRQIEAVIALTQGILARWPIGAGDVVGHSDVAPMRKRDPGERFPWRRLAAAGIGLWPDGGAPAPELCTGAALRAIGYTVDDAPQPTSMSAAVRAFQRRFMPDHPLDGRDDPATRTRLATVARAHLLARRADEP